MSLKIQILPENYAAVLKNINAIIEPTRVQPGCLDCCVSQDIDDESSLLLIEEWAEEEQLQRHIRSEDFKVILAMMELSQTEPEFKIHTIIETKGIDSLLTMQS